MIEFVFSGYMVVSDLYKQRQAIKDFEALEELIADKSNSSQLSDAENNLGNTFAETKPAASECRLKPLFEKNADCIGWVFVEGTNVNYPVMHTPSDPQKYLKKNFDGEYSSAGVPFLDGLCTTDCDNLILYGHNMMNGSMFADVTKYRNRDYFEQHPIIDFETELGLKQYKVFAVVQVKNTDNWYGFRTASDENEYIAEIEEIKRKSLYDTDITPEYGQQVISLSTCFGAYESDRIVVIGAENKK